MASKSEEAPIEYRVDGDSAFVMYLIAIIGDIIAMILGLAAIVTLLGSAMTLVIPIVGQLFQGAGWVIGLVASLMSLIFSGLIIFGFWLLRVRGLTRKIARLSIRLLMKALPAMGIFSVFFTSNFALVYTTIKLSRAEDRFKSLRIAEQLFAAKLALTQGQVNAGAWQRLSEAERTTLRAAGFNIDNIESSAFGRELIEEAKRHGIGSKDLLPALRKAKSFDDVTRGLAGGRIDRKPVDGISGVLFADLKDQLPDRRIGKKPLGGLSTGRDEGLGVQGDGVVDDLKEKAFKALQEEEKRGIEGDSSGLPAEPGDGTPKRGIDGVLGASAPEDFRDLPMERFDPHLEDTGALEMYAKKLKESDYDAVLKRAEERLDSSQLIRRLENKKGKHFVRALSNRSDEHELIRRTLSGRKSPTEMNDLAKKWNLSQLQARVLTAKVDSAAQSLSEMYAAQRIVAAQANRALGESISPPTSDENLITLSSTLPEVDFSAITSSDVLVPDSQFARLYQSEALGDSLKRSMNDFRQSASRRFASQLKKLERDLSAMELSDAEVFARGSVGGNISPEWISGVIGSRTLTEKEKRDAVRRAWEGAADTIDNPATPESEREEIKAMMEVEKEKIRKYLEEEGFEEER